MPEPNPHIEEHVHDYDEIIMHIGIDPDDQEDLGAEIEIYVDGRPASPDRQDLVDLCAQGDQARTSDWKSFSRPHIEMTVMIGAGSLAEADPGGHRRER